MNHPSLDSLLLTLLATQTPEGVRFEGSLTILTFNRSGSSVEVSKACDLHYWITGKTNLPPTVWASIHSVYSISCESQEVAEAFDACLARTEPIKHAEIIAALKSITATP